MVFLPPERFVVEEFPGNSQRRPAPRKEAPKTEPAQVKKVERVVEGEVLQRKKSRTKRLRELFLGNDNRSIMDFIVQDVIIPNIRDMIYEAGQQGLERSLYPGSDPRPWRHGGPRGGQTRRHTTNYNGITRGGPPQQERQMSHRGRANHDFGEIVLPTRPEADAVLQGLYAILEEYDVVAVSDLYEMVGISSQFTDRNWGWTDLFGSDIQRDRDGYLLILPSPVDIRR